MTTQNLTPYRFFIFLIGFSFIFICYVGLPIDFHADYLRVSLRSLDTVDIPDLLRTTLNPLTPGWFYPPEGLMEYMRPLQTFFFQLYHGWFPFSLVPFQVTAALGHGLLSLILFLIIFYWTQSKLYGCLAVIFHASFPSNFYLMSSIGSFDLQYWVSVMDLTALFLFFFLTLGKFKKPISFFLAILGWVITIWLVIKLKSSEKILPFICLAFLIWRYRIVVEKIGRRRCAILVGTIMAMMLLVIPFKSFDAWIAQGTLTERSAYTAEPTTQKDKQAFEFHWRNGIYRTFFVSGEDFVFKTPYRKKIPTSFSGNLGFFAAWFFWLGLLGMLWVQIRGPRDGGNEPLENQAVKSHAFWLIFVWFVVILAGFTSGVALQDGRFLNFAYVPSLILLFMTASTVENYGFSKGKSAWIFKGVIALMIVWACCSNYRLFGRLIDHFGGMQSAIVRAESDVFESFFNQPAKGPDFYTRHTELENRVLLIDWYSHGDDWFDKAIAKLRKEKVLYFYSRISDSPRLQEFIRAGYSVELTGRYDFLDSESLLFKLKKKIANLKETMTGRRKTREILVYRILL